MKHAQDFFAQTDNFQRLEIKMLQLNCQLNIQDAAIKQLVIVNSSFDSKQLLDEVFVISRIIKVKIGVVSQCYYTLNERKNIILKACLCFFTDGKQQKAW